MVRAVAVPARSGPGRGAPGGLRPPLGLKDAIAEVMIGSGWQRCRVHLCATAGLVPRANAEMVPAAVRTIFASVVSLNATMEAVADQERERADLPSIHLLLRAIERQRDQQRLHFESLDNKAGIAVGFAGAIAALTNDVDPVLAKIGVVAAVVAAVLAMLAFRPRKDPILDPRRLRAYLRAEADFTKLRLLDTEIEMALRASNLIETKARWLHASLVTLVIAVALLAAGTLAS